jgi:hypothetical protein
MQYTSTPRKLVKTRVYIAILQGPIPLKIGLASFYPGSHLTKIMCLAFLPHTDKMGNPFFVAAQKTIVAKVVGNGDMHNPAKYGPKFRKFPFFKSQNPRSIPYKSKQTSSR